MLPVLNSQQAAGNLVNYLVERYCNIRDIVMETVEGRI